jgi:hypothetical protein
MDSRQENLLQKERRMFSPAQLDPRLIGRGRKLPFNQLCAILRANPTFPGVQESITQDFYDSFSVAQAAAVPAMTTLFQSPIGQGGQTLATTDMTAAGVLPNPWRLHVQAYALAIKQTCAPADIVNFLWNVTAQVNVGIKTMWQGPCHQLPGGNGPVLPAIAQVATAPATSVVGFLTNNGWQDKSNVYTLSKDYFIEQGENFSVVFVPQATTTMSANSAVIVGTGITVQFIFKGDLYRQV